MFQSFPLGAKSSVNTKGEFHTDNVTTFDGETAMDDLNLSSSAMSVDMPSENAGSSQPVQSSMVIQPGPSLSEDILYPIFWRLQQVFSNPPLLFKNGNFEDFKKGLDATLVKFKEIPAVSQRTPSQLSQNLKRKADSFEQQSAFANTFNPKYLTSRDLFSLEVSIPISGACLRN